jgi:hypothetical protein
MRSTHPPYRRAASGFRLSLLAASRHHAINSSSGFTALSSVIGGPSSAFIAVAMPDGSSFPTSLRRNGMVTCRPSPYDLEFIKEQLARMPTRKEVSQTALLATLITAALVFVGMEALFR